MQVFIKSTTTIETFKFSSYQQHSFPQLVLEFSDAGEDRGYALYDLQGETLVRYPIRKFKENYLVMSQYFHYLPEKKVFDSTPHPAISYKPTVSQESIFFTDSDKVAIIDQIKQGQLSHNNADSSYIIENSPLSISQQTKLYSGYILKVADGGSSFKNYIDNLPIEILVSAISTKEVCNLNEADKAEVRELRYLFLAPKQINNFSHSLIEENHQPTIGEIYDYFVEAIKAKVDASTQDWTQHLTSIIEYSEKIRDCKLGEVNIDFEDEGIYNPLGLLQTEDKLFRCIMTMLSMQQQHFDSSIESILISNAYNDALFQYELLRFLLELIIAKDEHRTFQLTEYCPVFDNVDVALPNFMTHQDRTIKNIFIICFNKLNQAPPLVKDKITTLFSNHQYLKALINITPITEDSRDYIYINHTIALLKNILADENKIMAILNECHPVNKCIYSIGLNNNNSPFMLAVAKIKWIMIFRASIALKNDLNFMLEAIKINWRTAFYASDDLKNNPIFIKTAIEQNWQAIEYASDQLRNNNSFMSSIVKKNWRATEYASIHLKNNHQFMRQAIYVNRQAIKYAGLQIRDDAQFMLNAIKHSWRTSNEASYRLKNNINFMNRAIRINIKTLSNASQSLKNNRQLMLKAIKLNYRAVFYASNQLKDNYEFMLEAAKINSMTVWYASDRLKNNNDFMLDTIQQNWTTIEYASNELNNDAEFMTSAIKVNSKCLCVGSDALKSNKEFILSALLIEPSLIQFSNVELTPSFFLQASMRTFYRLSLVLIPSLLLGNILGFTMAAAVDNNNIAFILSSACALVLLKLLIAYICALIIISPIFTYFSAGVRNNNTSEAISEPNALTEVEQADELDNTHTMAPSF